MADEPLRLWCGDRPSVRFDEKADRLSVVPVLRAHLDDRFEPAELARRYGALRDAYSLTGLDEAELAVVPRVFEHTDPAAFRSVLARAERRGLRTLVFGAHDLEPLMPDESVILLHAGPTRGAQPHADVLAVPFIFTDRTPVQEPRPGGDRPSVAFCGQGAYRRGALAAQMLVRGARLLQNRFRPRVVAPPLRGHVGLRASALRALSDHSGVDDRFLIRDRYRAGVSNEAERAATQAEFDDNLRSSTYALCVRGTGNFSARFYEALSFGRVPLFVDTDCVLPFEDEIDWRARTVWVPSSEVESIADRLVESHRGVVTDPARDAVELRRLWEDRLTTNGYFSHLPRVVRALL